MGEGPAAFAAVAACVSAAPHSLPSVFYEGIARLLERASEPLLCSPLPRLSVREAGVTYVRWSVQACLRTDRVYATQQDEAFGDQQGSGI